MPESRSGPDGPDGPDGPVGPVDLVADERRTVSEPILVGSAAALAGVADAALAHNSGQSWPGAVFAGVVMGAFVGGGVWFIRSRLRRVRLARTAQAQATAQRGAVAKGGWANPTSAQRFRSRWRRMTGPRPDEVGPNAARSRGQTRRPPRRR